MILVVLLCLTEAPALALLTRLLPTQRRGDCLCDLLHHRLLHHVTVTEDPGLGSSFGRPHYPLRWTRRHFVVRDVLCPLLLDLRSEVFVCNLPSGNIINCHYTRDTQLPKVYKDNGCERHSGEVTWCDLHYDTEKVRDSLERNT